MAGLQVNVNITDLELFQDLVQFLRKVVYNERIPENVRNDIMDEFDALVQRIVQK